MAENADQKYSRVVQMIVDDGGTWDLSPNDKAALRHVIGMVNVMADELAQEHGQTIPYEIKRVHEIVDRGDIP